MGAIDVKRLREEQEKLEKRGSRTSNLFINKKDLEEPKEVRIMEPTMSMEKLPWVEVPVWWIGTNKLVSLEFLGEECFIKQELDAIKQSGDPDYLKLLRAKRDGKYPQIKFEYEYMLPVLQLNFDGLSDNLDELITGEDWDLAKIKERVVDNRIKIATVPLTLIRSITAIATARGGTDMTDRVKGFNLLLSKTGKGTNTKYSATRLDVMPMPVEFYENPLDLVQYVKSYILTEEYQGLVLDNYFDGKQLPENRDDYYMFPEDRKAVQDYFKESEDDKEEASTPTRRPRGRSTTGAARTPVVPAPEKAPEEAPSRRGRASAEPAERPRVSRGAGAEAPARPARGRRNLMEDMEKLNDE